LRERANAKDKQNIADQPTEFMEHTPSTQPTLFLPDVLPQDQATDEAVLPKLQLPRGYGKRFSNVRFLGQGGSGAAYAAFDTELERTVTIKVLHNAPTGLAPKEFARHEARTVANLHHPGIVTLYDCISTKEQAWLLFEYVPGVSLAAYLEEYGPLPAVEAINLCIQMCEALEYAHNHGVWHLDIKPGNILVNDKHVKITDFGIGLKYGGASDKHSWGTPGYAPDEQLAGHPTAQSDVYAIAAVLWAMLTGNVKDGAFSSKVRKLWRKIPHELRAPLRAALSRRLSDRPRNPGEFAKILRGVGEQANGQTTSQKVWNASLAAFFIVGVTVLLVGDYPISLVHSYRGYWLGTLLVAVGVIKPALAVTMSMVAFSCAVFWRVPTLGVMTALALPLTALMLRYRFRGAMVILLGPFLSAIGLTGLLPVMAGGLMSGISIAWVAAGSSLFVSGIAGLAHTPLVQTYFEAAVTALPQATLFRQVLTVVLQISPKDIVLTLCPALLQSIITPPTLWLALVRLVMAVLIGVGKERLTWPYSSGVIIAVVMIEAGLRLVWGVSAPIWELIKTILISLIFFEMIPGRIEGNLGSFYSWVQRLTSGMRKKA
jgi:hypothetical protein